MSALLLLVALGIPPGPAADDLPSPAALFDLYCKNFDGMRSLKLQWRRDHKYTDDWLLSQEKALEGLATEIARLDEASADSHTKRQEMMNRRQQIAINRVPKTMFQTFLTDRRRFMMRTAPANWGVLHTDDDWLMPDVAVMPESMSAKYPGFTLLSYPGGAAQGFRTWSPQPFTAGHGMIQVANVPGETNFFPPLGVFHKIWGGSWHPIDTFFQSDPKTFRTVGRATINGHETVMVEARIENTNPRSFLTEDQLKSHGGRIKQFEIVRAYLDPQRGGLPWKIEWDGEILLDGQPKPQPTPSRPYRVLEVTEILDLKGAGFYPSKGIERTYGQDPRWTGSTNIIAGMLEGKVVDVPTIPFEETSWQAAKVEANEPLNETFAMKYPDGVYYLNGLTNTSEQAGWENRNVTLLPWSLCGLIVAGWVVYGLVILIRMMFGRSRRPAVSA